jgi:radical SAM superfamily enzyme YgiQ (UPF0313 family)
MHYVEPIFRPPSEARSLLLQTTVGCSHNRCTFCAMYMTKKYRQQELDTVFADIEEARGASHHRRAFLLDGDALAAPEDFLTAVLSRIHERLPHIERVGVYGDARAILGKGEAAMARLEAAGLGIVYHGVESGDPQVLEDVRKPLSFDEMSETGRVMRASGVAYSVMAILGLGGEARTEEHAANTAEALNRLDPDYIGLLTLMLVPQTPFARKVDRGELVLPDRMGLLKELRTILAGLDVTKARFSANHASNYLPITGDLPAEQPRLLAMVDGILSSGDDRALKPEWMRGL